MSTAPAVREVIILRLPSEIKKALRERAKGELRSLSAEAQLAIEKHLFKPTNS